MTDDPNVGASNGDDDTEDEAGFRESIERDALELYKQDLQRRGQMAKGLKRVDDLRQEHVLERLYRIEAGVTLVSQRVTETDKRLSREVIRRIEASERHQQDQDKRIDSLESYRDGQSGAVHLIQALIGTSVVSAILGLIAVYLTVSGKR